MRFLNDENRVYFFIWIAILLLSVVDFARNFIYFGLDYFLTLDFYVTLLLIACMVFLFIGLMKNNIRIIVLAFGGVVTLEAVKLFPEFLAGMSIIVHGGLQGYDIKSILFIIVAMIFRPFSLMVYALTYIACMVYFFFNKRTRHTLIPVVSGLGVVVLLAAVGTTAIQFFFQEIKPGLLDIFLDLAFAVFFHIIYITLPRIMHGHNLY